MTKILRTLATLLLLAVAGTVSAQNIYRLSLVTDASTLQDGGKIIIAAKQSKVAMGAQRTNNRGEVQMSLMDGVYYAPATVLTLAKDGDTWTMNDGNGYLYAAGKKKQNYLKVQPTASDAAKATITIGAEGNAKIQFSKASTERNILKYNENNGAGLFSCYSHGQEDIQIFRVEKVSLTVTAAGYATISSVFSLDFTNVEGLTAYAVTSQAGGKAMLTKIEGAVPACEGVLVKADAATYEIPFATGEAKAVEGNLLKGSTDNNVKTTGKEFILADGSQGVGFYKVKENQTIKYNTAYLVIEDAGAKGFVGFDETTGISSLNADKAVRDGIAYNLAGQRVGSDYKGIVIINGKKIVKK